MEEISTVAQELYQSLRKHLQTSSIYQGTNQIKERRCLRLSLHSTTIVGLSDDDQSAILDWAERYALVICHKELFCPAGTEDEEKDLQLQNRIRRLNWINTKHLGCQMDESSQDVRDILHDAITSAYHILTI